MIQQQTDVYEKVTNAIIHAIETGAQKYTRPWHLMSSPVNAFSRKGYRGINVLMLWISANEHAYASTEWATYKQSRENGAQVRKGERSTPVVFWKFFDQKEESENNPDTPEYATRCFARSYNLFNANQVDGYQSPAIEDLSPATRIGNAECFFSAIPVNLKHGGDRAFYSPTDDYVQMPDFGQFHSPEKYYSVLSHEVAHWSGSVQRLNRDLNGRFGSEAYAWEELIAQLSSAFVCSKLQLSCNPETDDAPYVNSCLRSYAPTKERSSPLQVKRSKSLAIFSTFLSQLWSVPRERHISTASLLYASAYKMRDTFVKGSQTEPSPTPG